MNTLFAALFVAAQLIPRPPITPPTTPTAEEPVRRELGVPAESAPNSRPEPGRGDAGPANAPAQGSPPARTTGRDPAPREREPKPSPEGERTIALPPAGEYRAGVILQLVGELTDRRVLLARPSVREIPVRITLELSRLESRLDELRVLLAAHEIYLHDYQQEDGERAWVASRSAHWERPEKLYTRVLDVAPELYERSLVELQRFQASRRSGPGLAVLPMHRVGRILIRSKSQKVIELAEKLLQGLHEREQERREKRPRLYSYVAQNSPASELLPRIFRYLSEDEARRVHAIRAQGKNVLLFRTTPELWTKIEKILPAADSVEMNRPKRRRADARDPVPPGNERVGRSPVYGSDTADRGFDTSRGRADSSLSPDPTPRRH